MSCIASAVSRVSTAGSTVRKRCPPGPSRTSTPSVVSSRYSVGSGPSGSSGEWRNSGEAMAGCYRAAYRTSPTCRPTLTSTPSSAYPSTVAALDTSASTVPAAETAVSRFAARSVNTTTPGPSATPASRAAGRAARGQQPAAADRVGPLVASGRAGGVQVVPVALPDQPVPRRVAPLGAQRALPAPGVAARHHHPGTGNRNPRGRRGAVGVRPGTGNRVHDLHLVADREA